ncbi:MAG: hypothetical protein ACXVAX_06770 [Pseudobdellovibrio sp.]
MDLEKFKKNAHLYLGLSRTEFARRASNGQIDYQLLKAQIEQNAMESKLEVNCERYFAKTSIEQVDKNEFLND